MPNKKPSQDAKFRKIAFDQKYPAPAERLEEQARTRQPKVIDIEQEIARRQQLENDNAAQDIKLKKVTLDRLFRFLTAETALVFLFALFQAIHWPFNFGLDEWSFKLLLTVTIAQITGMLFVAVRYLFPKK